MRKEWTQVRRDAMTLRILIAIPIMQLFLFGYAINTDPKNLPTGLLSTAHSKYERTIIASMKNSGYYHIVPLSSEAEANEALADGELLFVIEIPPDFDRAVDRGESPSVLIDADATDPSAIGNATAALSSLGADLQRDLPAIRRSPPQTPPFQFVIHARYNPERLTVLNIVPGLVCMILIFSTLFATTLSITKERERGTMENLLAMPVRPLEVMLAKITPYLIVGYAQLALVLVTSSLFFDMPIRGSIPLLLFALGLFMGGNLALGVTFSTVATNQMQATQMAQFMLMPSFLLSGFMFPFLGMPRWAQWVGELLPTTHAIRIVRGIMLKGNGWTETAPDLWPLALFMFVVIAIAVWFYRETLD
jgi:ABC-2 type transport system permease protein